MQENRSECFFLNTVYLTLSYYAMHDGLPPIGDL